MTARHVEVKRQGGEPAIGHTAMVCHVISTFPPVVGGAQRVTHRLCRALREHMDILVLTRALPGTAREETIDGVRTHRMGLPLRGRLGAATFGLHAFWFLIRNRRRHPIVHTQSLDTPLLVGLMAKWVLRRPLVLTVHGEEKIHRRGRTAFGRLRLHLMWRSVDSFTALTEEVAETLRAEGVDADRIVLLPNGVDVSEFRPPSPEERLEARRRLGIPAEARVAVFIGRLIQLKRVDLLLEAWAELDLVDGVLLIVGQGSELSRLRKMAESLGLRDRVRFEGLQDDVRPYLWSADVMALPSREEGFSLSLLEAMASGCPAVVTRLPGHEAALTHRHDALLVEPEDAHRLRKALGEVLEQDSFRRSLAKRARETVLREYTLTGMARSHRALYRELAD